jgi:hypothetical protein
MAAVLVAAVPAGASGSPAARDRTPPRIVAAAMLDTNGNARADRVRITYSERVRHVHDRDGAYPFRVAGYRIRSVTAARGRVVVIELVEKDERDPIARPAVRYRRTTAQPVRDRAGNQARSQVFRGTRPHGNAPPLVLPPTGPTPPAPDPTLPPNLDPDGDGYAAPLDCAPHDPSIHPGAPDLPDLAFVDSNCDGIDGTERGAVFASPLGADTNPGTRAEPKRSIDAAVAAAASSGRYVLAAAGRYGHVEAQKDVGIYGGYEAGTWSRSVVLATEVVGVPEGIFASGATGVVVQLLTVRGESGAASGGSAYGIRAVNGSHVTLQRATVVAGNGAAGAPGAGGRRGLRGENGAAGSGRSEPTCEQNPPGLGGSGGDSPVGRHGGRGGDGGKRGSNSGQAGSEGRFGTTAGKGGAGGSSPGHGTDGANGSNGQPGQRGDGGTSSTALAGVGWRGSDGGFGRVGGAGNGGGGGGGGGGRGGLFVIDRPGMGGGGGGGGGGPGFLGDGGGAGGGSFGVYLFDSVLVADRSDIGATNGGVGGRGGDGGAGGPGGAGGRGSNDCTGLVGRGGSGGRGGTGGVGGAGGGGAGGPSVGVMRIRSEATLVQTPVSIGAPGAGGAPGTGGTGGGPGEAGLARAVHSQ